MAIVQYIFYTSGYIPGIPGTFANAVVTVDTVANIVLSQTPIGAQPATRTSAFLSGSGAPGATLGANGDYYFRSDAPSIYVKTSGEWSEALDGKYLYLPQGWDDAWKAAKALAGSQRVSVVGIGDSITNGWNCTDIMVDSWWARLRSSILAANDNALGGDFHSMLYSAAFTAWHGGPGTVTPPLVVSGTSGVDYSSVYGVYGTNMYAANALSPAVVCSPLYSVVGFDIVYLDLTTGSWTYQIDGGSATTVTTSGSFSYDAVVVKKRSITGLSSGSHTLRINAPGGGVLNVEGITCYKSNTGICFANMGLAGMGLYAGGQADNNLAGTASFPPDRLALYQGYQGTTASPTALSGFGFPAQPDLAIVALGVNDAYQYVSKDNFKLALLRLIWSLRYGKADACSIVIVAMWMPDGTGASSTSVANTDFSPATGAEPYRDIHQAMIEVAQSEECAFVDVHSAFGRKPVTNGWITNGDVHPTVAGHQKIADLIGAIV